MPAPSSSALPLPSNHIPANSEEAAIVSTESPRDPLPTALADALAAVTPLSDGEVADYIPELSRAVPDRIALAICLGDGQRFAVGDVDTPFTLQSACKPFLYGSALAHLGSEAVHRHVGVEPIGERFDSIVRLDHGTHRPHNPMINAGAITVAGLLASAGDVGDLLDLLRRWAGNPSLHVDMAAFLSERETADRNRAIAHLLAHFDVLPVEVERALELYTLACSTLVTVADLAAMGATLANDGVQPLTSERLLEGTDVREVLTVMMTCGLYDGAGPFAVDVGLPAKSGVSGAMLAVVPGRMGIAAYSPRLDGDGNSVRGKTAVEHISRRLELSVFRPRPNGSPGNGSSGPDESALEAAAAASAAAGGGTVASYIETLANADPNRMGAAVCAVDGREITYGDADLPFTVQAAANPFAYALALSALGRAAVGRVVGTTPSGNPFDAIYLDPRTERPYNALSSVGAIAVAGNVPGSSAADRFRHVFDGFGQLAGAPVQVDASVLEEEWGASHRNRAIAYLLRDAGVIDSVEGALDLYLQQCSAVVDCRRLARMAATLATGGRNPATGASVFDADTAQQVLAVMFLGGLHDASGRFAFEVGVPAKSGISGAIVAAVPGRLGLAVLSPPVDRHGTSVRGRAFIRSLAAAESLRLLELAGRAH